MAISPSIFTTYKEYLENVNIANYFLLISIFLAIMILICGVVFTNIKDLYSNESKIMDYQKYKEKNVIFLMLILNFITLIIYIFGVMYNHSNNNSSFPNFIVYPCLQSLNFVFLILEKLNVFDYFYFREFINKEVNKKIILEDVNYRNDINVRKLAVSNNRNADNNNNNNNIKCNYENNKQVEEENIHPSINFSSKCTEKQPEIKLGAAADIERNNENNVIKESSHLNGGDVLKAREREINMHQHKHIKEGKSNKNQNPAIDNQKKSARNLNLEIKSKHGIYSQFNNTAAGPNTYNNFSLDHKYETANKNWFDFDKNKVESFVDYNNNNFHNNNIAEDESGYNNKKLNTTVGELYSKKMQLEKIDEKHFVNLNVHKTNANNLYLENENNFGKSAAGARRSFAGTGDKFKLHKKSAEGEGNFEILDEESKEDSISISNNENSFELKRNKDQDREIKEAVLNKNYHHYFEVAEKNPENANFENHNKIHSRKLNNNNTNIENNNQNNNNNKSFILNENLQNSQDALCALPHSGESEYRKFIRLVTPKEVSILFTILVLGVGSVIGNLNNIEFIISSISKTTSRTDIFEYSILYFSFNSLSRLASGIIIDKLILHGKIFFFLLGASLFGLFSQVLGIIMTKEYLVISICLAGSVHGALLTFAPIYTKNFFDLDDMGKILGFLTTGAAIGSVFVGNIIFTIFYDVFKKDDVCKGQRCFRYSYVITTVLFLVNIGLSLYLMSIMSKRVKKQKEQEIKNSNEIELVKQ